MSEKEIRFRHNESQDFEVKALNAPRLEIEGIEELEERLEMAKICGSDCCKWSSYGSCK